MLSQNLNWVLYIWFSFILSVVHVTKIYIDGILTCHACRAIYRMVFGWRSLLDNSNIAEESEDINCCVPIKAKLLFSHQQLFRFVFLDRFVYSNSSGEAWLSSLVFTVRCKYLPGGWMQCAEARLKKFLFLFTNFYYSWIV